jgi:trans-aconitate methyltransferase
VQLVNHALSTRVAPGSNIVELGCGPGGVLAELASRHPEARFLGVDVEEEMIIHARDHHAGENVRFELVDLSTQPPAEVADFAYSIDLLHHVRDVDRFLAGVHAAVRRGATWLVIEPNVFHPYIFWSQARMRRAGFDEDHFRPWRIEPALERAAFEVRDRRYAFLFPGWVDSVPSAVAWLEPLLERARVLGGSVVYVLERS